MSVLLASLPLQLVCQLIIPGSPTLNDTNNIVPSRSPPQTKTPILPSGYHAYPKIGSAYKTYFDIFSWNEARKFCLHEGTQLAVIDSTEKLDYLRKQRLESYIGSTTYTYVGIHSLFDEGEWISVSNGTSLTSIPWAEGKPSGNFDCVIADWKKGGLSNWECHRPIAATFVCELPIPFSNVKPATLVPTQKIFPKGYVTFPEHNTAYKIHKIFRVWDDARFKCIEEGGHLAVINSFEKISHVRGLPDGKPASVPIHVGIHRSEITNEWIRVDTALPVTNVPWAPGSPISPNSTQPRRCAGISWDSVDGLTNYDCDVVDSAYAVCEIPI